MEKMRRILQEAFGDPIIKYAGDAPDGVRSVEKPREVEEVDEAEACSECGYMEVEGSCGCTHEMNESLWKNVWKRRRANKRPKRPGEKGYPKTLNVAKK